MDARDMAEIFRLIADIERDGGRLGVANEYDKRADELDPPKPQSEPAPNPPNGIVSIIGVGDVVHTPDGNDTVISVFRYPSGDWMVCTHAGIYREAQCVTVKSAKLGVGDFVEWLEGMRGVVALIDYGGVRVRLSDGNCMWAFRSSLRRLAGGKP